MNAHERVEYHLDSILEKHIECNTKLLDMIKEERHYIVHNVLDKLEKISEEKMVVRDAINALENERMVLMPHFNERYAIGKKEVRLEDIIDAVPQPYKTRYTHKRVCLKKLLEDIKIAHEGNKLLIQQALTFHEKAFSLLHNLAQTQLGYGQGGEATHDEHRLCDRVG